MNYRHFKLEVSPSRSFLPSRAKLEILCSVIFAEVPSQPQATEPAPIYVANIKAVKICPLFFTHINCHASLMRLDKIPITSDKKMRIMIKFICGDWNQVESRQMTPPFGSKSWLNKGGHLVPYTQTP